MNSTKMYFIYLSLAHFAITALIQGSLQGYILFLDSTHVFILATISLVVGAFSLFLQNTITKEKGEFFVRSFHLSSTLFTIGNAMLFFWTLLKDKML
jgi:hypothetical protein